MVFAKKRLNIVLHEELDHMNQKRIIIFNTKNRDAVVVLVTTSSLL